MWALSLLHCVTQNWSLHCAACPSFSLQSREDIADLGKAFQKTIYEISKILIFIYAMPYLCNLVQVKCGYVDTKSSVCQGQICLGMLLQKSYQTRGTA